MIVCVAVEAGPHCNSIPKVFIYFLEAVLSIPFLDDYLAFIVIRSSLLVLE